jgi:hypothetical protein
MTCYLTGTVDGHLRHLCADCAFLHQDASRAGTLCNDCFPTAGTCKTCHWTHKDDLLSARVKLVEARLAKANGG